MWDLMLDWLTWTITPVIFLAAAAAVALHTWLYLRTVRLESGLRSVLDDTARRLGLAGAGGHARLGIPTLLYELTIHLRTLPADRVAQLRAFLEGRDWEKQDLYYRRIEMLRSMLLTLIESFPLLGIIGTAAAMARSAAVRLPAAEGGVVKPGGGLQQVLDLFGVATGTTILGLSFAVFFMFTYAWINARISAAIEQARTHRHWVAEAYELARREAAEGKGAPRLVRGDESEVADG